MDKSQGKSPIINLCYAGEKEVNRYSLTILPYLRLTPTTYEDL